MTIQTKHICTICHTAEVYPERIAIGKTHCMGRNCVAEWRRREIEAKGLVLANVHKQGPMWMRASDLPDNSMRRTGA